MSKKCPDCGSPLKETELDPPICDDCIDIRIANASKENPLENWNGDC